MPTFETRRIDAIKGKQVFEELVIDGAGVLVMFHKELLDPQYQSELRTILSYMEQVANNCPVPQKKFKDITPAKTNVKEYEFKSDHLRIYVIKKENGKIILLCGFKNKQEKDIRKFRSLKKTFLESKR